MKYDNDPLMFINTVNTKNKLNGQYIYDSRKDNKNFYKEIIKEENVVDSKLLNKLTNMIKQYEDNQVVIVKVKLKDEDIICIPFAIQDGRLFARKTNSEEIIVDIAKIVSVEKIHI